MLLKWKFTQRIFDKWLNVLATTSEYEQTWCEFDINMLLSVYVRMSHVTSKPDWSYVSNIWFTVWDNESNCNISDRMYEELNWGLQETAEWNEVARWFELDD